MSYQVIAFIHLCLFVFVFLFPLSMTLSSAPPLRRGSTPVPIKHQLRREEAVNDDCDWTSGLGGQSPPPISFCPAQEEYYGADRHGGPLRIALLGQNGVGKSSLAIALAGETDRTASVDSEGEYLPYLDLTFCIVISEMLS